MEATSSSTNAVIAGFMNLLIIIVALVIIYYIYQYLFGIASISGGILEAGQLTANRGLKTYTNHAKIYEGGEYTVNLWLYISGWSYLQGQKKHVFELGGTNFATLLIALGSYKNSLSVRVDAVDASGSSLALTKTMETQFFGPSLDGGLADASPQCDIDVIDLQRWVQISVVINGNICDVYMDGKLVRSCVLPSYYRVDPTGQSVKIADRGGFDGYISQVSTYNYAMSPVTLYNMYMSGPTPASTDVWGAFNYFLSLFQSKKN